MTTRVVLFCCLLVVVVGCTSAEGQSVPATDVDDTTVPASVTADAPDTTPDAATTVAPPPTVAAGAADELGIPVVNFTGEQRDMPVPYFGSQGADGGVQSPVAGFEPDPADAPFCEAIAEINSRPQPSDDYEEIVVAQQYFLAIEPVVPAELSTHFTVALDWLAGVVESGSFVEGAEPADGDALLESIGEITAWVDERCLGR